jgi:PIN domain nuclease of toxin-antitoxin system
MESQTALTPVILDSSVVLTYLLDEPGRLAAEAAIADRGRILSVNLAEVMGRLVRDGTDPGMAADTLLALPLIVIALDAGLAIEAGAMLAQTRPFGLSLGDRACLALAKREGLPALTADQSWLRAAPLVGIEVRLIR